MKGSVPWAQSKFKDPEIIPTCSINLQYCRHYTSWPRLPLLQIPSPGVARVNHPHPSPRLSHCEDCSLGVRHSKLRLVLALSEVSIHYPVKSKTDIPLTMSCKHETSSFFILNAVIGLAYGVIMRRK
jgi:hypothetical protein